MPIPDDWTPPWRRRQPLVVPDDIKDQFDAYVESVDDIVVEAPEPWTEGAEAYARNWMSAAGCDPNDPDQVWAFLAGLGCARQAPPDLFLGLRSRHKRLVADRSAS